MRRTLALVLLLLVIPSLLVGCGGAAPTDEEIKALASDLIADSLFPNETFLGDGIPVGEHAFDDYWYADEDWMREHDTYTVEALVAAAEAVYSPEVAEMLTRFAALGSQEELPHYRNRTVEEGLLVLKTHPAMFRGLSFEYGTDGMTVEEKSADRAVVSLSVLVRREGKEAQEKTLRLPLVRGEDGWRLDKLTYVAYEDVD